MIKQIRFFIAAILGNLLKHYDQSLYGFLVPFLAPLFFPYEDPVYSLLAGYALLPLGFFAKPIGAYVFGRLGDKIGRKFCLSITLLGMGLSTASIGYLPTFEKVGWLSPFLLSLMRLFQNFFAAGETTGGALFLLEQTSFKKRGLMSSLFDASGILGIFLAALAVQFMGHTYWRLLFYLGGFTAILGFILRQKNKEKVSFSSPKVTTSWSSSDWQALIVIALVSGFSYANYYLLSTFLNGFLPLVSSIHLEEALKLNTLLLFVDLLLLPCFGLLSLLIGKEKLILTAMLLSALLSYPLFLLLDGAGIWMAGAVRITFTVLGVCLAAPYYAWAMEKAPESKRFTICALGSTLGGQLIGAPMPALGLWLYHQTGLVASPSLPLVGVALLASGAIIYLKIKQAVQISEKKSSS